MISKDDMSTHPYRHKVYSCLGGDVPPKIELSDRQELLEGDTILLCTDGVWGAVADDQIKRILSSNFTISDGVTALLDQAEEVSQEQGDNMSAIGLQWGDKLSSNLAVSTVTMPMGSTTTIMNPVYGNPEAGGDLQSMDFTDEQIENTIAEIQQALRKTKRT
jgi:serine/threonine protein phosphatase PrpC